MRRRGGQGLGASFVYVFPGEESADLLKQGGGGEVSEKAVRLKSGEDSEPSSHDDWTSAFWDTALSLYNMMPSVLSGLTKSDLIGQGCWRGT